VSYSGEVKHLISMAGAGSGNTAGWLFIPVEVKVRELMAKTLLACLAAQRGYHVVLGEAHAVRDRLHQLPAGIVLEKGVAPSKVESFARFRSMGHLVAAWCEEGLVFFNDDDYVRRKVTKEDLLRVEHFFAWGPYQAQVIADRFPEVQERIVCSGNPRLDLLRPEFRGLFRQEAEMLRERLGPFILVNTNFQHCNHQKGEGAYVELIKHAERFNSKEEEAFAWGWIKHKQYLFDAFIPMIRRLNRQYPAHMVVIRPHPGEDHDTWRRLFESAPNVLVTHEGGVIPWVLASDVLIHNGCTTGIEAALLDHPAIAYRPVISATYDQYLPNSVNYQADNEDQLIAALDRLLVNKDAAPFLDNPQRRAILKQFICGLEELTACESILDFVDSIPKENRAMNRRFWFPLHKVNLKAYMNAYTLLNRVIVGKIPRGAYSEQKFPGLETSELKENVARLRSVSGKFASVSVHGLVENVFLLSAAS
jgi:surface carbohydrate biosynthesis protein